MALGTERLTETEGSSASPCPLRPPVTEPTAVNNDLMVSIEFSLLVECSHDSRAIRSRASLGGPAGALGRPNRARPAPVGHSSVRETSMLPGLCLSVIHASQGQVDIRSRHPVRVVESGRRPCRNTSEIHCWFGADSVQSPTPSASPTLTAALA